MARICYVKKNFGAEALAIIKIANQICASYASQGYDLTLRQLYYQFVARDILPNTQKSYNKLGNIINDARLAGLMDWDYIVDRTRFVRSLTHYADPAARIRSAARTYQIDMWARQPERVEVWIEKDALVGVIERTCQSLDVPYFSCRGYTSQSEVWGAAQRIGEHLAAGKDVTILHLGDHDPSGIDMTRDILDRLRMFTEKDQEDLVLNPLIEAAFAKFPGCRSFKEFPEAEQQMLLRSYKFKKSQWGSVKVRRIALNRDQVDQYDPPPNPAKITDSRAKGYIELHGRSSWELDALEPTVLDALIREEIGLLRDRLIWQEDIARQASDADALKMAADRWTEVATFIEETTVDGD
jgi:hypothetical protein